MMWLELGRVRELAGRNPLALAFILSLLLHVLLWGTWRAGRRLHWWEGQPAWLVQFYKLLQPSPSPTALARLRAKTRPPQPVREIPLSFMEVDPALASAEPPKEAKYYGAFNAIAAQPDPASTDTKTPKIDGKQDKVPRLQDNPRPDKFPLQPAAPVTPQPAEALQPKPRPADTPGDLALVRPGERRLTDGQADSRTGDAARERPRTLAQALAKRGLLAGERMKQEGGVSRRGRVAMVDVKATPFGAYDAAFIAAVQQRWYDLIDSSQILPRSGKVVLHFRLTPDGRITDLRVREETVGELLTLLCQRAVLDPAPYAPWPSDMRRLIGESYREVTFTFYYN